MIGNRPAPAGDQIVRALSSMPFFGRALPLLSDMAMHTRMAATVLSVRHGSGDGTLPSLLQKLSGTSAGTPPPLPGAANAQSLAAFQAGNWGVGSMSSFQRAFPRPTPGGASSASLSAFQAGRWGTGASAAAGGTMAGGGAMAAAGTASIVGAAVVAGLAINKVVRDAVLKQIDKFVERVREADKALMEMAQRLHPFNARLADAEARANISRMTGDIQQARALGGQLSQYRDSRTGMDRSLQRLETVAEDIKLTFMNPMARLADKAMLLFANVVEALMPVLRAILLPITLAEVVLKWFIDSNPLIRAALDKWLNNAPNGLNDETDIFDIFRDDPGVRKRVKKPKPPQNPMWFNRRWGKWFKNPRLD